MGDLMIKAAKKLKLMNPNYQFFMPLSDASHLELFKEDMKEFINITYENSQDILKKSSMAIITSGTATLEAALSFTPCIAVYKTNWLSYLLIKPLLHIDSFSLPNLILGKKILPELLQSEATIEKIISSVNLLEDRGFEFYRKEFTFIKEKLKAGGADKASIEVLKLLN